MWERDSRSGRAAFCLDTVVAKYPILSGIEPKASIQCPGQCIDLNASSCAWMESPMHSGSEGQCGLADL
jgi:hypothetical protein